MRLDTSCAVGRGEVGERGWIGLVGVGAKGMVLVSREEGELNSLRGGKVGILAKSTVFGEDLCQSEGGAEWLLGRHGEGSVAAL